MKWKMLSRRIFLLFVMLVLLAGVTFEAPALSGAEQQVIPEVNPNDVRNLESSVADTEESLRGLEQSYQDLRLVLAHGEPPWPQMLEMFDARMNTTVNLVVSKTQAVRALLNAGEQITPAHVEAAFQDLFVADTLILEHYLFLVMNIDKLSRESGVE